MKKINSDNKLTRIEWACRRGMLELDVLLGNFFKERYLLLTEIEQEQFVSFLKLDDPEIYAWLLGHEAPPRAFAYLVDMIKTHARSRF